MATLGELVYNIKNLREGGIQSDDMKLSDEQIIFIINYYRARLIKQEYNKNNLILDGVDQSIGNVSVEKVNNSLFPTIDDDHRITEKIPNPITLPKGLAFRSVGKGENTYDYIPPGRASLVKYARYTSCEPYFYVLEDRLVLITNDISVKKLPITAIFENPVKAYEFLTKKVLTDYNSFNYPMPSYLLDSMYKLMMEAELGFASILPDENTNDTKDDLERI